MANRIILGIVAVLLVIAAAFASFYIAPVERTMGALQKIFYFHAASAWAGMDAFFLCFIANLLYVWKRNQKFDWVAVSATEVGLAFTTVVLITGPIWAKPAWGIWWTWDARLTSTFVLWLLYVSYLLLRTLIEEPDRRALLSAIFGVFAFLDVPLVYFSIRWWRTQHPQPVILGGAGSGLDPRMRIAYLLVWAVFLALMVLLLNARSPLESARADVDELRREAEAL